MKTAKPAPLPSAVAYSLLRFSSPEQAKGDSRRRQTEGAKDWCEREGVPLDTSLWLFDPAVSAYTGAHRKNPDRHALAAFLKLVESSKVPRGSYLIIENLDRLSREHIRPALSLLLNLIEAGVRVVQLKPVEQVFDEDVEPMMLMMAIMELSRGHGESKIKSERVGAAWQEKKRLAREGKDMPPRRKDGRITKAVAGRLPTWVQDKGGKLVLIPDAAATVKRIFQLARSRGYNAIVKQLTEDKAPGFGRTGKWTRTHVLCILRDRRALGEYQPRKRDGSLDGAPIPGYYPAVVGEDEWNATRAAAAQRQQSPGRLAKTCKDVNVFAGLLRNARGGDSYFLARWGRSDQDRPPVLRTMGAAEGRSGEHSFPFHTFEWAVLSMLKEIDPHEILNGDSGPDESLVLGGQFAAVESELAEVNAFMEAQGFSVTLGKRVKDLEDRQRELSEKLTVARRKAAYPLSEAWGETKTLMAALASATDQLDARLRLKSALHRIVSGIWMLVVGRGRNRLCACQVWFAGGERHRDYLIFHRPRMVRPHCPPEDGQRHVGALADVCGPGDFDLRNLDHVTLLESRLLKIELPQADANQRISGNHTHDARCRRKKGEKKTDSD